MVTELGGTSPISEARVEAGNWMTALSLARKAIGEAGGVPPGASCSVAPDGKVTIHDAVARKTYTLAPTLSVAPPAPSERRKMAQTIAYDAAELGIAPKPTENAPPPGTESDTLIAPTLAADGAAAGPSEPKRRKAPAHTIAYDAAQLGLAPPAPAPEPQAPVEPSSPRRKAPAHTIAYDAAQLGLAPPAPAPEPQAPVEPPRRKAPAHTIAYDAAQLGLAPPAPAPEPQAPVEPPRRKAPAHTIAYDAAQLGLAPATAAPAATPEPEETAPKRRKAPAHTIAYDAAPLGLPVSPSEPVPVAEPTASPVELQPAEPSIAASPTETASKEPDPAPDVAASCELLHARDEEPTRDMPLVYRERTYAVGEGAAPEWVEQVLLARFEELFLDLADRAKGKLVNMAVFDHAWSERPLRPPLLTLQWKDWRGDPVLARAGVPPFTRPLPVAPPPPAPSDVLERTDPAVSAASDEPATTASLLETTTVAPISFASEPETVERRPEPPSLLETTTVAPTLEPASAEPAVVPPVPVEAAVVETPVVESPVAETPVVETPVVETPVVETPVVETPVVETPVVETPVVETPVVETRVVETAVVETPVVQPASVLAMEAAAVQLAPEPQPPAVERPEVVTLPAPVPGDLELSFADDGVFERTPVEASADERLATAFEALQDLFFLTTAHEGLDFVMRLLEDLTPAEAASACLYDINTDELRFVALTGPGAEERKGDAVPRLAGLIGSAALAAGDALVIHDVSADPRFDPGVDGRVGVEVRSMALAAVLHGGRLFGLLQLINRRGLREFSATDANILAYVAEKLGEFLHLARLRPE